MEVLKLALPLIVSVGSFTLQMFVDRIFLKKYHPDAMAGTFQSSSTYWTIFSLFFGIATYTNTFVSQYFGAKRLDRIGAAIWQGIFFSLAAGILLLGLIPLAGPLFDLIGHEPAVRRHEITYFRIIGLSAVWQLLSVSLTSFYTGRRKNVIVMTIRVLANLINILCDYLLIFGHFGFPRLGVAGAALGTMIASMFSAVVFLVLFLRKPNREQFATLSSWRPEKDLLSRLLRFGTPNGVQFMLDGMAFTLFFVFIGRIDKTALTASGIAFNINILAFLPMVGLGIAVTTLVGNALGDNKPERAEYATWSASIIAFTYMALMALGFILAPDWFIRPFQPLPLTPENLQTYSDLLQQHEQWPQTRETVVVLLRFIAFYCLFDTGTVIFAAALKGAGDTRFIMWSSLTLHWVVLVAPTWIAYRLGGGLYTLWYFMTAFVTLLALSFLFRFLQGKWKTMRVIEAAPQVTPPVEPLPTTEIDMN